MNPQQAMAISINSKAKLTVPPPPPEHESAERNGSAAVPAAADSPPVDTALPPVLRPSNPPSPLPKKAKAKKKIRKS